MYETKSELRSIASMSLLDVEHFVSLNDVKNGWQEIPHSSRNIRQKVDLFWEGM